MEALFTRAWEWFIDLAATVLAPFLVADILWIVMTGQHESIIATMLRSE